MLNWPAGLSVAPVKSLIFTSCSINQVSKQQMSLKFIRERLAGRMTSSSKYQIKTEASSDISDVRQMRLVWLLQSLANSQEQRGRVLDNIIYCDRQIVFSRERARQQIARGPGCSCLPWKCVCVYLLLERCTSFSFLQFDQKKTKTKNKCDILCVDAVHAVKSVPREASERDQYQQTARMRCLHAAKPDAKPHEAAPTSFMSYGK